MAKNGNNLGPDDLRSDIPLVEASSGQEQYCQVSLTFGQSLDQADLQSDLPPVEASGGQEWC